MAERWTKGDRRGSRHSSVGVIGIKPAIYDASRLHRYQRSIQRSGLFSYDNEDWDIGYLSDDQVAPRKSYDIKRLSVKVYATCPSIETCPARGDTSYNDGQRRRDMQGDR
jgi:hypothetical protein